MKRLLTIIIVLISATNLMLQAAQRPTLILFISIDQMRPDYLERYKDQYVGGFKKLIQEGVVYTNADLNYSGSWTAPGHAALSTGTYPRKNGIISNEWIDPVTRKTVYCVSDFSAKPVEGEGGGYSPRNLRETTIGDWLKSASPTSRVISISGKERAAILMGGHHADYAFWYDRETGHMVTSDYYTQQLPAWAKSFNASEWIKHNVPDAWTKLLPEELYLSDGPDEFAAETPWGTRTSFPHVFEPGKKERYLMNSPYGDHLVLAFAGKAFHAEQLGQRNVTDYLSIDLSCTDYIGHNFGPNSHEMHDHLLRLDRALGALLDEIERTVGRDKILLALSADHGVLPLPEYLVQYQHQPARRILFNKEIKPKIDELDRSLQQQLGLSEPVIQSNAFLHYAAASSVGVDSLTLEQLLREGLLKIEGIADVYFRRELINPHTPFRPYLDRFQRSYYPPRGQDFIIRYCEYCLVTSQSTGTSHSAPYRYDTHVPVVFWGAHLKSKRIEDPIYTVDVAPTLAKVVGIDYPSTVDGKPLTQIIPPTGAPTKSQPD